MSAEGKTILKIGMPDHVADRLKALCAKHGLTMKQFTQRAFATYEHLLQHFGVGPGGDLTQLATFLAEGLAHAEALKTAAAEASEQGTSEASK